MCGQNHGRGSGEFLAWAGGKSIPAGERHGWGQLRSFSSGTEGDMKLKKGGMSDARKADQESSLFSLELRLAIWRVTELDQWHLTLKRKFGMHLLPPVQCLSG